ILWQALFSIYLKYFNPFEFKLISHLCKISLIFPAHQVQSKKKALMLTHQGLFKERVIRLI
ncbi:hypothetical protein TW85_05410, partial [Marinomonas sp. S3726]